MLDPLSQTYLSRMGRAAPYPPAALGAVGLPPQKAPVMTSPSERWKEYPLEPKGRPTPKGREPKTQVEDWQKKIEDMGSMSSRQFR
jgi:hypothetical protein